MKEPLHEEKGTTLRRLPLYCRLAGHLRRRIRVGDLPAGSQLPSSRAMARQLGVSRNTVVTAYEVLACEGMIAIRRGSGTRVIAVRPAPLDPHQLLREAHYPSSTVRFHDSDGNIICLQR